jgi:hypothetical protein
MPAEEVPPEMTNKTTDPLEVEGSLEEGRALTNRHGQIRSGTSSKKKFAISTQWERENEANGGKAKCCTGTMEDCYGGFCCFSRRVGSMFFLWEKSDGSPIVVAGPCWPFCVFITVPLIIGLSSLTLYYCILDENAPLPFWWVYIYCPLMAFTLISLFFVSCRDPGLMERQTETTEESFLWNEQVGSFRPPGAMYCRECKVVIQDYDHLCPWTGTGIGARNMTAFKFFVLSVNLLCYGSIAIVAYTLLKDI